MVSNALLPAAVQLAFVLTEAVHELGVHRCQPTDQGRRRPSRGLPGYRAELYPF